MAPETKIVIADDHPIVRQGLRQTIEREVDFKVVGEASEGLTAIELIKSLAPAVAILDIDMPQLDGFGVARAVREQKLSVEMIFLTVHAEEDFFKAALDLGAKGYVLKDSAVSDIVASIRAVLDGQYYSSPALTTYLVKGMGGGTALTPVNESPLDSLTPTERRVLNLIAEYRTSKEIAAELYVSPRTIETHRNNICNKLNLRGNHALMKFALAHKSQLD
ncbi:MAG: response regulator transcription factor [Acidobacteria bacterium]|nr:response regulator transcription factor [Acidobacteriota bacterium]